MSFDGIVTRAVVTELRSVLLGGRIDKIFQQEKDELLLQIYNNNNYRLLLSASSNNSRIYLTNATKTNPLTPPMFCMLLRKHLSRSIILDIQQHNLDRVVIFTLSGKDELGNPTERELIVEIMGKHSNIILTDKTSKKVIDSIKRIPAEISRVRQILPGFNYSFIEAEDKTNPLKESKEGFLERVRISIGNQKIFKFLYQNYIGLSPLAGREISSIAGLESDRTIISLNDDEKLDFYNGFVKFTNKVINKEFQPAYILNKEDQKIIAFYAFPLSQYKGLEHYKLESISQMLDFVYKVRDTSDRISQKSSSLKKSLQTKLERAQNKLTKQKEELFESQQRGKYKIYADLIQSNLHRIKRGSDSVILENFYDVNMEKITVPLDLKLSPVDNAQKYYKKYGKLKTANKLLLRQIPETESEISYIEHVLVSLDNASEVEELDEIKEELIIEGYIQKKDGKRKNKKTTVSRPLEFMSSDGFRILVGRNNRQNEILTMKTARKEDLWLHTKDIPGSHVIIKTESKTVPETTLIEAATLSAYYSKSRHSQSVEVDYTEKKYVRKPRNAKTGLVNYENQKTLVVNPSIDLVEKLKK